MPHVVDHNANTNVSTCDKWLNILMLRVDNIPSI